MAVTQGRAIGCTGMGASCHIRSTPSMSQMRRSGHLPTRKFAHSLISSPAFPGGLPHQGRQARRECRQFVFKRKKKTAVSYPLTEEECELVNQTLPDINGIKQAAAAEESIVALLGRLFEVVAVTIMTIYGLKAVIVGAHDFPTFVQFFFQGGPPEPEFAKESSETFLRIRECLGQGILIGLEFLIISDVFETVGKPVEDRSIEDLVKLGTIVIIRTVIEYSLRE